MATESVNARKAHVAIHVKDVGASVEFYEKLFGIEPCKVRTGYAKFDVANPPLNFTLNEGAEAGQGALSHLGIQVESTADVLAMRQSWLERGLLPRDEMKTECCFALQDKAWVRDPDGNEWEAFAVLEDNLLKSRSRKNRAALPIAARPLLPERQRICAKGITMEKRYNVLFLCTGNSARSIMAEAILNRKGRPNFVAYSAGSHPSGQVRPEALRQIELARMPMESFRSKNWDEFAEADAPKMDFVFTVCDDAASEVCPVWPGQPMTGHWGVPDPATVQGSPQQIERAFREAFMILDRRISLFLCLPLSTLGQLAIKKEIDLIGLQ